MGSNYSLLNNLQGWLILVCFVFQALERMRPYLCDKIIAERHFDYLRSKKILTREDTEEISARSSSRKKTGKLLDYLAENPKGLDTLVESIRRERTQNFLLEKITDVVLKVKNEKLEALKGNTFLIMLCKAWILSVCKIKIFLLYLQQHVWKYHQFVFKILVYVSWLYLFTT